MWCLQVRHRADDEWGTLSTGYDKAELQKKLVQWQQNYFRTSSFRIIKGDKAPRW